MSSSRSWTIRWLRLKRRLGGLLGFVPGQKAIGYDFVRLGLGCLLLVTAGLKAHQLATEPILGTSIFDSRWLLMAVVECEIFFGLWLLVGLLPRVTWAAAVTCFASFTCVSLYKALSGAVSCGCFGRVEVNPWITASLDLAIVVTLAIWRPKGQTSRQSFDFLRLVKPTSGVLAVWLLLAAPAAWAMGTYTDTTLSDAGTIVGDGKLIVLEPEKWIGKRFPLLNYIEAEGRKTGGSAGLDSLHEKLTKGDCLVLFYHRDCQKCQETIEELPSILKESRTAHVALIEMPPYGTGGRLHPPRGISHYQGNLTDAKEWFCQTPLCLKLHDGRTVQIVIGEKS